MTFAMTSSFLAAVSTLLAGCSGASTLAGSWRLVAADKQLPDGTVGHDYGAAPRGRLIVDASGRYSLQIFSAERADFASGDKAGATETEIRSAVVGSSTHYGTLQVDWNTSMLTFVIADSSFPNWRGQTQTRRFTLDGDTLTYRVPPRPDGSIPISVWHRER